MKWEIHNWKICYTEFVRSHKLIEIKIINLRFVFNDKCIHFVHYYYHNNLNSDLKQPIFDLYLRQNHKRYSVIIINNNYEHFTYRIAMFFYNRLTNKIKTSTVDLVLKK